MLVARTEWLWHCVRVMPAEGGIVPEDVERVLNAHWMRRVMGSTAAAQQGPVGYWTISQGSGSGGGSKVIGGEWSHLLDPLMEPRKGYLP